MLAKETTGVGANHAEDQKAEAKETLTEEILVTPVTTS